LLLAILFFTGTTLGLSPLTLLLGTPGVLFAGIGSTSLRFAVVALMTGLEIADLLLVASLRIIV